MVKGDYVAIDMPPWQIKGFSFGRIKILVIIYSLLLASMIWFINPQPKIFDYSQHYHIKRDPLYDPIGLPTLNPSEDHLHNGSKAMVASDVPICSSYGKEIMLKGGNAADAAVTVALCIGSINSHSSGIGGGGFIVSSLVDTNEVLSIDAREMAPSKAFKEMYASNPMLAQIGGLAVAIPGELKGLFELFRRHGSGNLAWYDLFEPVIKLNRDGFNCSTILYRSIKREAELVFPSVPEIEENWDFIYKDGKQLVEVGDLIKRGSLANTLELIAKNGSADIFYDPDGPFVSSIVETANRLGGMLTKEDFANYKVNVEPALSFNFTVEDKLYKVFTSNGASSGLALLAGLNFFNKVYNESTSDLLETHKLIESMKWMASARSYFGDFSLNESSQTFKNDLINQYTSTEWSTGIIESGNYSDFKTFPWQHYNPKYELTEPHGTSHFSVIDQNGNSVCMTTTVNLLFGSMVYDNRTGVILNNQMDDFSLPHVSNAFNLTPSIYNFIEPAKRPLSSTSPTIIISEVSPGNFVPDLLIGAAGGSRITTAIFQAIVRILYNKFSILKAISFPRLHHQLIPEFIMVENITIFEQEHEIYSTCNIKNLMNEKFGHDFYESGTLTAMNGIKRKILDNSEYIWEGVSDYWRKRGEADGY